MNRSVLSRLELLLAAGATALAGLAPVSARTTYDTIVVGAGAAGIAAARTVRSHGRSVLILEATGRVGGRIATDNSFAAPFDFGAQFFSATASGNNALHAIAKHSGITTIRANAVPLGIANGDAPGLHSTYASLHATLLARAENAAGGSIHDTSAYDAIRHLERLPHLDTAISLLTVHGASLEAISLLDYHNIASRAPAPLLYPADDTEYIPSGIGNFITDLASGLPIAPGNPVTSIEYGSDGVTLRTKTGRVYHSRTAVVTTSTGALASKIIAFEPALPEHHIAAIQALPMGHAYKAALGFTRNLTGTKMHSIVDLDRPSFSFTMNPFDKPMVVFSAGGDLANQFERMPQNDIAALFLKVLEPLYPGATSAWDRHIATSTWSQNPYTRGASSYATVGNADARAALAKPIDKRLWFAGEATSALAPGQVHGAWNAGVLAARGALAAIGAEVGTRG